MPLLELDLFQRPSRWISIDGQEFVMAGDKPVPITYQRNRQARRYRLYLDPTGQPRVTIPCFGSRKAAREFVRQHAEWLAGRIQRWNQRAAACASRPGAQILWRGVLLRLETTLENAQWVARFGAMTFPVAGPDIDLKERLCQELTTIARQELPPRVQELAAQGQVFPTSVRVGDQASRWGSASKNGTICLNWRLLQMPLEVRDYIIWHELMHLREMNHSRHFWALVAAVCPDYNLHRRWLRAHNSLLQ